MKTNNYVAFAVKLALIVACVGFLLAGVHALTADRIAEVNRQKSEMARRALFTEEGVSFAEWDGELTEEEQKTVSKVYLAYNADGMFLGYCFDAAANGFKGEIAMVIGVSSNNTLVGVEVQSHSETPGIGTKALGGSDWLSRLKDRTSQNIGNVETISGATKTSKPIKEAVAAALRLAERIDFGGL